MFKEKMECLPMVMMSKMAELVYHNIIRKYTRQTYKIEIKIDIILSGTASPVGGIVLNCKPVVDKAIAGSKFGKSSGQFLLGTGTKLGNKFRSSLRHIRIFLFLPGYDLYYAGTLKQKKSLCSSIRHHIWNRHGDAFDRVHTYADTSASDLLTEDDFA